MRDEVNFISVVSTEEVEIPKILIKGLPFAIV